MRTITIALYSAAELKTIDPEAYKKAWDDFAREEEVDTRELDKSHWEALRLAKSLYADEDWGEVGPKAEVRRWARWNTEVTQKLIYPYVPNAFHKDEKWAIDSHVVGSYLWRRRYNKPGAVAECPLTGYFYDMDFLSRLEDLFKLGCTLAYTTHRLWQHYLDILTVEQEAARGGGELRGGGRSYGVRVHPAG